MKMKIWELELEWIIKLHPLTADSSCYSLFLLPKNLSTTGTNTIYRYFLFVLYQY